jgi:hypothetical protein
VAVGELELSTKSTPPFFKSAIHKIRLYLTARPRGFLP